MLEGEELGTPEAALGGRCVADSLSGLFNGPAFFLGWKTAVLTRRRRWRRLCAGFALAEREGVAMQTSVPSGRVLSLASSTSISAKITLRRSWTLWPNGPIGGHNLLSPALQKARWNTGLLTDRLYQCLAIRLIGCHHEHFFSAARTGTWREPHQGRRS